MNEKKLKIAIFDDVKAYLDGMREVLEEAGYDVKAVLVSQGDTIESVVQAIKGHEPDIVMADENLSSFSGFNVLNALGKKFFSYNNPRVISVSIGSLFVKRMAGGSFELKKDLTEKDKPSYQKAKADFLEVVDAAVKKTA